MVNVARGGGPSAPVPALDPVAIINAARQAVPAVDYALGVAGVAAAGAIIGGLLGYTRVSIIVLGGILVAMILLFAFARLVAAQSSETVCLRRLATENCIWALSTLP
jgi:hypothetical protein